MKNKEEWLHSSKECVYIAMMVAILIVAQWTLSFISGVEIVTVLFATYAFVFGVKRGILVGIAFSLVRQLVFGFYPYVLILYATYYPLVAICFGLFGKRIKNVKKKLVFIISIACLCTVCFTFLDTIIFSLWYGLSKRALEVRFYASLSVMAGQTICTAITVALLFVRLKKTFQYLKNKL